MSDDTMACPQCEHPMMSGFIGFQPRRGSGDYRNADWWCANCHHVIWTQPQPVIITEVFDENSEADRIQAEARAYRRERS